ncbi:MAG: PEP-CTERM system histidine kinase PrsK [Deltaproteobacteria bacterium]|nr:PEP-CTERM system histidine kinase PrsK [Deltaproteobacteria bacterium]TLN01637.1 MAG: PEP-CTERM system histidine kinase PrsK [bacterium]
MLQTILTSIAIFCTCACFVALYLKRDERLPFIALTAALAASGALELFDLLAIMKPADLLFWKKFSLGAEGLLIFCWLLFSSIYARREGLRKLPLHQKGYLVIAALLPVAAISFPASQYFYSPDFERERMLFLGNISFAFYIVLLILLVIALINLESVLRNMSREVRWQRKFEIIGAGALLAVLIFYYSQGLLFRSINMNLIALRSLALITAAVMIAYSRIWRTLETKAYVSQQIAYRSVVLFAVGLYLVGLGLLGEGMRYFGDSFQRTLLMGIGFIAGVGLLAVLLSESVKRKIRVFLHKNFYRQKYDYRTQWLQFTDRIASARSSDDLLSALVLGFCETFGMGCGALFLTERVPGKYYAAAVLEMEQSPFLFLSEHLLPQQFGGRDWVVRIPEELPDATGEEAEFLSGQAILFAVPLLRGEHLEGFILLGRPLSIGESYHYEDFDLMKTLARQASSALLNLRLSDELSLAREMEAVGKVSAFVLHDLKNLASALALMVDNAREHMDNPEFQEDMLQSLESTVTRMKALIARLKKIGEKHSLRREPTDLRELSERVMNQVGNGLVTVAGTPVVADVDREEIEKVLLNLLLNALESSVAKKGVSVEVGCDSTPWIRVIDQGCGMSEEFLRTRLFKPFSTTKEKGLGIGLYQCRQIVEAHGGRIEVQSEAGKGSVFTVRVKAVEQ